MFVCVLRNAVPDSIQVVSRITLLILKSFPIPLPRASKTSLRNCVSVWGKCWIFLVCLSKKRVNVKLMLPVQLQVLRWTMLQFKGLDLF